MKDFEVQFHFFILNEILFGLVSFHTISPQYLVTNSWMFQIQPRDNDTQKYHVIKETTLVDSAQFKTQLNSWIHIWAGQQHEKQ